MAKFEMQAETEHAILFLADSGLDVSIPQSDWLRLPCATADCLCFPVLAYVDGASVVTVTDEERSNAGDGKFLFSCVIESKTGVLSLFDSSAFSYLNIPVPVGQSSIHVSADDEQNPSWVWLKLGAIRRINS